MSGSIDPSGDLCSTLEEDIRRDYPSKKNTPASMTRLPRRMFRHEVMNAISARYKICVRCGKAIVHSSGVGRRTCMNPLPLRDPTLEPKGIPTRSEWR